VILRIHRIGQLFHLVARWHRDFQMATSQWVLGKSFDTHAPFGPWITTSDEVGDPHTLGIRSFVNGEKRQDSNTSNFVFNVWEQVEYVSKVMTLEPGDLIFTGTPAGVGPAVKGDRIEIHVEGVTTHSFTLV